MRISPIACQGPAGSRLLEQLAIVLDPIADHYGGDRPQIIRPIVAQAWHDAFGTDLSEPTLSRCTAAMASGQSWTLALWSNDWP
jgi:hypothetical protein